MENQRVIITVHARGITDEKLNAIRNGISGLINGIPGAVMQTRVIEQTVTASEPPPAPPPPE